MLTHGVVGDGGTLLRYDAEAAAWARVNAGTSQNLTSIHGRGTELWVAGVGSEVRRYDFEGELWERPPAGEEPAPAGQLSSVQVSGARVYVASDKGQVYVWDTSATCPGVGDAGAPAVPCPGWSNASSTGRDLPIFGLWANGTRSIAVGSYGSIVSWEGEARSVVGEGSSGSADSRQRLASGGPRSVSATGVY